MTAAGGNIFLDESGAVEAEGDFVCGGGLRELFGGVKADDAGAAAADVGLDDDGEAETLRGGGRFGERG